MISIILPTYNNYKLFLSAISHILKQVNVTYEIIVVDDSTDNAIEDYCKQVDLYNLSYHHNRPSKGAIGNWNYGLTLAKGDYIILHHHDEYFDNIHHLEIIEQQLKKYDVVVSNIVVNKKKGINVPVLIKRIFLHYPSLQLFLNMIGPCACVCFKRSDLQLFDENLKWKVDSEWYYRILSGKKIKYLDKDIVMSIHGHKGQITQSIDVEEWNRKDIAYLKIKYVKCLSVRIALDIIPIYKKFKEFFRNLYNENR